MVLNTSDDLPDPDTPVKTVSRRFGSSMLTSLRLFSRAPWTRIRSWLSAEGVAMAQMNIRDVVRPGSACLLDAELVAGRVAERAVADAVRLVHRLLDHLGAPGLDGVEGVADVGRRQVDAEVGA